MNPLIRESWVAALRSGRYRQTSGKLTRLDERAPGEYAPTPSYCCLGVLCALAVRADGVDVAVYDVDGRWRRYDDGDNYLPRSVVTWADLAAVDPYVTYVDPRDEPGSPARRVPLSTLNDGGVPFTVIADLVEAQL